MIDKSVLIHIRSLIIQLLNALDDALGYDRTIPNKEQRRLLKKLN